jgi:hypothetical protein
LDGDPQRDTYNDDEEDDEVGEDGDH